jgi:hypothetical protein
LVGDSGKAQDCDVSTAPRLDETSSSFVDDAVQCQGLRGFVKLNEAACLKFDIRSFQVVTDRLAKLVGYPNSFPNQQ